MEYGEIRGISPALRYASCGLRIAKGLKTIFMAALLLPSLCVFAEDMRDPMRPPQAAAAAGERRTDQPRWRVSGILVSPGRRLAMINDRLIGVGEQVDGARVRNIYGDSVELDIDGRPVILRPLTGSFKRVE
jgi:hypothetical protein